MLEYIKYFYKENRSNSTSKTNFMPFIRKDNGMWLNTKCLSIIVKSNFEK